MIVNISDTYCMRHTHNLIDLLYVVHPKINILYIMYTVGLTCHNSDKNNFIFV